MLTIILVLTIFNSGLIFLGICGLIIYKEEVKKHDAMLAQKVTDYTKFAIEQSTSAIFNMDSIKQKVDMTGKFEI